jgi:Methyltransferase domain
LNGSRRRLCRFCAGRKEMRLALGRKASRNGFRRTYEFLEVVLASPCRTISNVNTDIQHRPFFGNGFPADAAHPAIDYFGVWQRYRKVIDANYMHHAEFSAHIEQVLCSRFASRPFSILDLGCGDTAILAPMLANMEVRAYEGVDLSEAALALAEQNLKSLSCPVHLTHSDLLAALKQGHRRYDVIHTSYAVHHLSTDQKGEFFALVAKRLEKDGFLLLTDVTREEDESLPVHFQRYCDWLRRDWHGLSEDEKTAICDKSPHSQGRPNPHAIV